MNPSNFDELTRALAETRSRRHALRVIVTASIGGLFGLTGISTAFGRHRVRPKRPAPPRGNSGCVDWCAQVFGPNTSAAGQCTSDAARGRGLCATCGSSTPPQNICCKRLTNGYCSGTSAARCPCNSSNCETCDTSHGTCGPACSGSQTCCGGNCKNTQTDESNCGTCGNACDLGETCCSGVCKNTDTDSNNCGACGTACSSPNTCVDGQCICVTPPPPPTGTIRATCHCNDGSTPSLCLAESCDPTACLDACLCHGGYGGLTDCGVCF